MEKQLVLVWERDLLGIGRDDVVVPLKECTEGQFEMNSNLYGAPKGRSQEV